MRISDWSSDVCSSDLFGSVDELTKGERLRRRRPHEVIAMNIVDVDRHHIEAGQGPQHDLDAHEQRQPLVRAPYEKRPADVRHCHLPSLEQVTDAGIE